MLSALFHSNSNRSRPGLPARLSGRAGTTIVEAVISAGVLAIAMAGMLRVSTRTMSMLKTQSETAQASQAIQERADFLRSLPYGIVTSSVNYTTYNFILSDPEGNTTQTQTGIITSLPTAANTLTSPVETITISAYLPTGTAPTPFTANNQGGTVTVTPATTTTWDLSDQPTVRVDVKLDWKEGKSGRARSQEASFVISQKGVGK